VREEWERMGGGEKPINHKNIEYYPKGKSSGDLIIWK